MFDQLDKALLNLLSDRPTLKPLLPELFDADVSFETPEKAKTPQGECLNLFLFETKENRDLREALPLTRNIGGVSVRQRAPLRVDCSYMVTAWSGQPDKVAAEHKLLGQAFHWLSRFPRLPLLFFDASVRSHQAFEPPAMVAQMDGAKSAGEFWHALGIAPRPYFNLIVTLTLNLGVSLDETLVTTLTSHYHASDPAWPETRMLIGGTVRDSSRRPVPDAWVRLDPTGETAVTDGEGRFLFQRAQRGSGYTLTARAPGFAQTVRASLEIPSLSGEYDLTFP